MTPEYILSREVDAKLRQAGFLPLLVEYHETYNGHAFLYVFLPDGQQIKPNNYGSVSRKLEGRAGLRLLIGHQVSALSASHPFYAPYSRAQRANLPLFYEITLLYDDTWINGERVNSVTEFLAQYAERREAKKQRNAVQAEIRRVAYIKHKQGSLT
jgi:hypothetical protein